MIIKSFETKDGARSIDNLKITIDVTGSFVAIASSDNIIRIRKSMNGKVVAQIYGSQITSMFYTLDNKNLVVSNLDGCVLIWKLSSKIKVFKIAIILYIRV